MKRKHGNLLFLLILLGLPFFPIAGAVILMVLALLPLVGLVAFILMVMLAIGGAEEKKTEE